MNGIKPIAFIPKTRIDFLSHGSACETVMLTRAPLQENDVELYTSEQVEQIIANQTKPFTYQE